MKKKKVLLIVLFFVSMFVSMNLRLFSFMGRETPSVVYADENLVSYALSWRLNTNIPYIYGGERNTSLEDIASRAGEGTDCSGFVHLVYKHFGINIPTTSRSIYNSSEGRHFYSIADALPGDICHWDGHVALYLGNGRIIHTNTSRPGASGRDNLIHVSIIDVDLAGTLDSEDVYRFPEVFIRFVDDEDLMSGDSVFGDVFSDSVQHEVEMAAPTGSLVTESDLTGMPTEWSLEDEQKRVEMATLSGLSIKNQKVVLELGDSIEDRNTSLYGIINIISMGLGIIILVYSLVVFVCYLFDRSNQFIDVSLLSVVSFGRWVLLLEDTDKIDGKEKTYMTGRGIVVRLIILLCVSVLFISGLLSKGIWWLMGVIG